MSLNPPNALKVRGLIPTGYGQGEEWILAGLDDSIEGPCATGIQAQIRFFKSTFQASLGQLLTLAV